MNLRRIFRASGLFIAAALLPTGAFAGEAGFEGVWRQTEPRTTLHMAESGGIPFTDVGRARYEANRAAADRGDLAFDPVMTSCASPGQPRLMLTTQPFAVFVRPSMVTILYDWNRLFRQISVGEPLVNPALGERWWEFGSIQGHARARWDAGELIVETRYFLEDRLLDAYLPASDQLRLTEHWRLVGADRFENRITIEDPVNYTRPWDATVTYQRLPADTYPFAEDVCLSRLGAGQAPIRR